MEYRKLGGTDLKVSILGFGASPLGDVFGPTDPAEGRRAVHVALDHGINFFDVSPYYGPELAEERLGEALRGNRHRAILATKCGRYGIDKFDFSAKRIQQGFEESLLRLRTDYVDLLQAHDVEFGDPDLIIHETLPAMRRLQEQGKARYIGITGYPLDALIRIAMNAQIDTILSYCHYNLLIDRLDAILTPVAVGRGIGVINASALHMGVLTGQGAPDWHPAPQEIRAAGQRAAKLCRKRKCELPEVALRFCLDYPHVGTTLVGMSTSEQVLSNLRALSTATNAEIMQEVRTILAPVFNREWPSGRVETQYSLT